MSEPLITGVGSSDFGRFPDLTEEALAQAAILAALKDAGVGVRDVEAFYCGNALGGHLPGQRVLRELGTGGEAVYNIDNACSSGATAFHLALQALRAGQYETVLVFGMDHLSGLGGGALPLNERDWNNRRGLVMPALYAMRAKRYMHEYGVSAETLADVSVKNRRHGMRNPIATFCREVTREEVLSSRMVADPLTLLQCCPTSDGAAAAVLAPATGGAREVTVRGVALRSGAPWNHRSPHVWGHDLVRRTAMDAFAAAELLDATDVDVAEVHDAFTIGEIVTTEALGFVAPGDGGKAAAAGVTALGGVLPVNPSGGLLSRGHPLGATGLAQLAEIVWQLRGEARGRQVEGARLGLVETMGGGVSVLDGNSCVVAVLEAP